MNWVGFSLPVCKDRRDLLMEMFYEAESVAFKPEIEVFPDVGLSLWLPSLILENAIKFWQWLFLTIFFLNVVVEFLWKMQGPKSVPSSGRRQVPMPGPVPPPKSICKEYERPILGHPPIIGTHCIIDFQGRIYCCGSGKLFESWVYVKDYSSIVQKKNLETIAIKEKRSYPSDRHKDQSNAHPEQLHSLYFLSIIDDTKGNGRQKSWMGSV